MKILGLDLGTKTLGVSISDNNLKMAFPKTLIKFKSEDYTSCINKLLEIIKEENINEVVLGFPKNMDNSIGFAAKRSLNFKKMLEDKNIKVNLIDERLTTKEALNIMKLNGNKNIKIKEKTDILASVLILESFLKKVKYEKQNNNY